MPTRRVDNTATHPRQLVRESSVTTLSVLAAMIGGVKRHHWYRCRNRNSLDIQS